MKFISLLFIAMLAAACSSEPANNARPNSNTKTNAVSPTPAVPATASSTTSATTSSAIPTTPIVSDGKTPLPEVEGTPVPTVAPNQQTVVGADPNGRRRIVDQPATGPTPAPKPVPAGENSEVTTTMDRLGRFVETRVFKGHAQLVKAERGWVDASGSVLTLTLKNGKQVRGSGAAVPNMIAATAVDLLMAVGVKPEGNDPKATGARQ
ncbi:MAG TPA: hypothetical protein PKA82_05040 [Pyrinomonadaceae bacterium]|nr:hypothetical protein [Pyrinomonadaceae bacterium]